MTSSRRASALLPVAVLGAALTGCSSAPEPPSLGEIKLAQTAFADGFAPYVKHASGPDLFAADQPEPEDLGGGRFRGAGILDLEAVAEQERLHSTFIASVEGWLATSRAWTMPTARDGKIPAAGEVEAFNDALQSFSEYQDEWLDWLIECSERETPSLTQCDQDEPSVMKDWGARLDALAAAEKGLIGTA